MLSRLKKYSDNQPDKIAISNEGLSASFMDLCSWAESVSRFLAPAKKSLVIYIALPGGPEFTALQLGIIEAGCIAVPIPPKLTTSEAARFFAILKPDLVCLASVKENQPIIDALPRPTGLIVLEPPETPPGPHWLFPWRDILQGQANLPGIDNSGVALPEGTSMVQFTSGTTGWPKAILLRKAHLLASQDLSARHLAQYSRSGVFSPIPQFHAMGNAVVIEHLLAGSPVHLANSPMYGEHIKRLASTHAIAVQASPNYFRVLLRMNSFSPGELPDLQFATIGSDWIDLSLIGELRTRFPNLTIFCRYGLSEAYGALAYNVIAPETALNPEGALVTFLEGVTIAPAEATAATRENPIPLRIRSPSAATHQLLHTGSLVSLLDADDYLNTGDLIFHDSAGRTVLAGRESQFIKFNGYRISPFEVEETLRGAPGVLDAYVTGIPDPGSGQRIIACIEPSGSLPPPVNDLIKYCLKHLSSYKIPQRFLFGVQIPKTSSGKVARRQLAENLIKFIGDTTKNP